MGLNEDEFEVRAVGDEGRVWFKYGRLYADRARQVEALERVVGFRMPANFLELLGNFCEGGFDGYYRVYRDEREDVIWRHLLVMKVADEVDGPQFDTIRLLRERVDLFGEMGGLRLFPFGRASVWRSNQDGEEGYLAFDVERGNEVVFVTEDGKKRIKIAGNFAEMVKKAYFVHEG